MFGQAMVQLIEHHAAIDYARLRIFQNVELQSIEGLLEACPFQTLSAGDVLITPGQSNQTLYAVVSGRLRVHLDSPASEPVALIGPGESVAELSVIDRRPTSAWVIAEQPTCLLAVDQEVFWSLIRTSHAFACNMLAQLADRLRQNNLTVIDNLRLQQAYHREAVTDELTGLANRRGLESLLSRLIARSIKGEEALSVLLIDIDDFRRYNEEFGHVAGEHVLIGIAQILRDGVRPTDMIGRFGGEEFVVVMPDTGADAARIVAGRLRDRIGNAMISMSDESLLPPVSVSVGIAERCLEDDTADTLLACAAEDLARARRDGGERISG
jgi:diguanylate cyclase (GGDEF)-like protein